MIIEGNVERAKIFGSYCAIILDVGNDYVRALAYTDFPLMEGEKIRLEGHYRQRDDVNEFFSRVLKKC